MNSRVARILLVVAAFALLPSVRAASSTWWRELGVAPVSGTVDAAAARWFVVVFISPECPLSNGEIPVLNRLAGDFASKGCVFVGAYADPYLETAALRQHARDYKIGFPTVDDRAQRLMGRAGASYTPEVAVFSADGTRLYRGRIDDRVTDFQAVRPKATRHDLRDVLTKLVAGAKGPFPEVPGFGCTIPKPRASAP